MNILNWYRRTLRNPKYRWWIILGSLVYLFSPLDISPDVFPIVGQIDDVAVLTLLISEVYQLMVERFKPRQDAEGGQPFEAGESGSGKEAKTVDVDAVSVD